MTVTEGNPVTRRQYKASNRTCNIGSYLSTINWITRIFFFWNSLATVYSEKPEGNRCITLTDSLQSSLGNKKGKGSEAGDDR